MDSDSDNEQNWYFEGYFGAERTCHRFSLRGFPALIGRSIEADVIVPMPQVSTRHAEVFVDAGKLWLRDLGSSNGTFLNRQPVKQPLVLEQGDVVHVAGIELLFEREAADADPYSRTSILSASPVVMATGAHSRARSMRALLSANELSAVFQPIVSLRGGAGVGFEMLGRGTHADLPHSPGPLFLIAEEAGLAAELSRAMRCDALESARSIPGLPRLYTNVHPEELNDNTLIEALTWVREQAPDLPITVEVHESTITDPAAMRRLRVYLRELNMQLAFDDFGAGQARLLELAECPPDCLKFDMSLIRDIDTAAGSRQRMVETLVQMAKDCGVVCLAEGIERDGELQACRAMGFDLAQGYLIAPPAPAERWQAPWAWDGSDSTSLDPTLGRAIGQTAVS